MLRRCLQRARQLEHGALLRCVGRRRSLRRHVRLLLLLLLRLRLRLLRLRLRVVERLQARKGRGARRRSGNCDGREVRLRRLRLLLLLPRCSRVR